MDEELPDGSFIQNLLVRWAAEHRSPGENEQWSFIGMERAAEGRTNARAAVPKPVKPFFDSVSCFHGCEGLTDVLERVVFYRLNDVSALEQGQRGRTCTRGR